MSDLREVSLRSSPHPYRGHFSAIFVMEEAMAAFDAKYGEAPLRKCGNQLRARDAWNSAHAAIVMRRMPIELQSLPRRALDLQTQLYRFANP